MFTMMIKTLAITALLGLAPLVALAGDDSRAAAAAPSNGFKSISEIEQQLKAEGFKITDLERERRTYEVTGLEKSGRCVELRMDAKFQNTARIGGLFAHLAATRGSLRCALGSFTWSPRSGAFGDRNEFRTRGTVCRRQRVEQLGI